jgi:hypothetical protein
VTRPTSWYPLAGSDPVPGDPVAVRRAAEEYSAIAQVIGTAAATLRRIATGIDSDSDAVKEAGTKANEVAETILKAENRYTAVGSALGTYATHLSQAQSDSVDALTRAQNADAARTAAENQVRSNQLDIDHATDADPAADTSALDRGLAQARGDRDQADAALAGARHDLERAVDLRDTAARRAIDAIEGATDKDGLDDGWWENWGSKVAHWVSDVAGAIAAVAGILSLFLGWVPILGQVLVAVALIAGAVALIADIALLIAGEGSWLDVGLGVLGLVTFGLGRAVGGGVKAGRAGLRAAATTRAATVAARSGNPAVRANPARLVPAALRQGVNAPRTAAEMNALIKGLPLGQRVLARTGAIDAAFAAELNALRDSGKLARNSTLVAGALQGSGALKVAGVGLFTVGSGLTTYDNVKGFSWLDGLVSPDDPLHLD